MCDPTMIAAATTALSVGQKVLAYQGQSQQAASARTVAGLNFANRSNIVAQQSTQLDQERSEKALDTAITSVRTQGTISASASDLGYGPSSLISALNADEFGIGRIVAVDEVNDRNSRLPLSNELTGANIERVSAIARNPKPSKLGLAIGLGQSLTQGASDYKNLGGSF